MTKQYIDNILIYINGEKEDKEINCSTISEAIEELCTIKEDWSICK